MFNSQNTPNDKLENDLIQYLKDISGSSNIVKSNVIGKGITYSVKLNSKQSYTLRNFSKSANQTGARWTIDLKGICDNDTNEIKFK